MTTPVVLEIYRQQRNSIQKQVEEARKIVRDAFNEGAQELLTTLDIKSFAWKQYTPYFNDGDACVFRVHNDPYVNGYDIYDDTPYSADIPDEFVDEEPTRLHWDSPEYDARMTARRESWYNPVSDFIAMFSEDDLLWMFGDHALVLVTKNGVDVQEYSHD